MTGVIKRIVSDKGFGFIKCAEGEGREFFFHRTGCDRGTNFNALQEGDEVYFEEEKSPKGPRAGSVRAL